VRHDRRVLEDPHAGVEQRPPAGASRQWVVATSMARPGSRRARPRRVLPPRPARRGSGPRRRGTRC
jgi:hypothetical protein